MNVGIVTTHISPAKDCGGASVTAGMLTKAWAERRHKMTLVEQAQSAIGYSDCLKRGELLDLLESRYFLALLSGLEAASGLRENFGKVVAEAMMAAGRPVLVDRGLALDHLESLGAGIVLDKSGASICDAPHKAQALACPDWGRMPQNGWRYVKQQFYPAPQSAEGVSHD